MRRGESGVLSCVRPSKPPNTGTETICFRDNLGLVRELSHRTAGFEDLLTPQVRICDALDQYRGRDPPLRVGRRSSRDLAAGGFRVRGEIIKSHRVLRDASCQDARER